MSQLYWKNSHFSRSERWYSWSCHSL